MKHFESSKWADMVRGLVSGHQQAEMQAHLDAGCKKCARTVNMLSKIMPVTAVESEYEPPVYAVESARRIFALQSATPKRTGKVANLRGRVP